MFQFLCLISIGLQKHENEWQVYLFFELHNLYISLFHLGLHSHSRLHMSWTLILKSLYRLIKVAPNAHYQLHLNLCLYILNRRHACKNEDSSDCKRPDMNSVFYSEDPLFHEWCLDYFRYRWYNSKSFDEGKLLEV